MANVFRWTGHFPEKTRSLVRHLAKRAEALKQVYPREAEDEAVVAVTTLVDVARDELRPSRRVLSRGAGPDGRSRASIAAAATGDRSRSRSRTPPTQRTPMQRTPTRQANRYSRATERI